MRLHRYFGSHFVDTLRDKRLYVAKPSSFNDPFELFYRNTGNWKPSNIRFHFKNGNFDLPLKKAFIETYGKNPSKREFAIFKHQQLQSSLQQLKLGEFTVPPADLKLCHFLGDRSWRICCFTKIGIKPTDEILLWSHYASKHFGARIEFELPYSSSESCYMIKEVDYWHERVPFDPSGIYSHISTTRALKECLTRKSTAWSYENEVRLIIPERSTTLIETPEGPLSFMNFEPEWVRSIDFGLRCNQTEIANALAVLRSFYPNAIARKAEHHRDNFELEYHLLKI